MPPPTSASPKSSATAVGATATGPKSLVPSWAFAVTLRAPAAYSMRPERALTLPDTPSAAVRLTSSMAQLPVTVRSGPTSAAKLSGPKRPVMGPSAPSASRAPALPRRSSSTPATAGATGPCPPSSRSRATSLSGPLAFSATVAGPVNPGTAMFPALSPPSRRSFASTSAPDTSTPSGLAASALVWPDTKACQPSGSRRASRSSATGSAPSAPLQAAVSRALALAPMA